MEKKAVKRIFEEKHKRRIRLSHLSFVEKIKILIELQKMAAGICENPRHIVWPS